MKVASTNEINKARELLESDEVELAIKEYKKLSSKYPNDSVVYFELGTLLLRQKINISEAFYYLSLATNHHNKNAITFDIGVYYLNTGDFEKAEEKFSSLLNQNETFRCYGFLGLIRTYIHNDKYELALDCFNKMDKVRKFTDFEISHYYNLKFFLLYKNGVLIDESRADNYFRKQLINYSKEDAIEHIKEHLKKSTEEELKTKRFHSVFEEGTDIEGLYNYCSSQIKDKKPDGYGIVDYYKCKLEDKVGATYTNKETTHVEVVTFPNSKVILSIYPVYENHVNKVSNPKEEERKQYGNPKRGKKKVYKKNHK